MCTALYWIFRGGCVCIPVRGIYLWIVVCVKNVSKLCYPVKSQKVDPRMQNPHTKSDKFIFKSQKYIYIL